MSYKIISTENKKTVLADMKPGQFGIVKVNSNESCLVVCVSNGDDRTSVAVVSDPRKLAVSMCSADESSMVEVKILPPGTVIELTTEV